MEVEKMLIYRYLIGYISESRQGQCIASKIISGNKPILNSKDIEEIQLWLQKDCGVQKIRILSFSKLEGLD